jgi:predicted Zn-dependent protease
MSRFPFSMRRSSPYDGQRRSNLKMRLIVAALIAAFALYSYFGPSKDVNQVTGNAERVAFNEEAEEVQMGLAAVRQMVDMHGGVSDNAVEREWVARVGERLLQALDKDLAAKGRKNPYRDDFRFTLLADNQTVNAFALPGGKIFITAKLFHLLDTEGQLAGVLGHEVGHVIERHSNKRMAKEQLFQGLAAAGGVAGGDVDSARMAQAVAGMISMKYGRDDELESDKWGVRLTAMAGYDPRAMIGVMKILDEASHGQSPPEFLSTHPKPANRVAYIEQVIQEEFPDGLPSGLEK